MSSRNASFWLIESSFIWVLLLAMSLGFFIGLPTSQVNAENELEKLPPEARAVAEERGLTPKDITSALKTYTPSGEKDPYLMFASGGHSGQMFVIGVPSMRLLKVIGVFTPEPWQGWGYGDEKSKAILNEGQVNGSRVNWGDVHHPALSETKGDYDGEYLFANDKAHARVAVISLKGFETKQIVKSPVAQTDHGATFVTPDTEYIIEGPQYSTPLGGEYAPLSEYEEKYRGAVTLWKFDRSAGRIDREESFAIELPPYWQDLCDAGKKTSSGWFFCNSINTEMATGGVNKGNPPFEVGASQREMDYLHVFNWKKAAKLVEQEDFAKTDGMEVIPLEMAIEKDLVFFVPEPKSPHGVDVAPGGNYLVVSGKLDPHVTVYNFEKIKQAIEEENFQGKDRYEVPILEYDQVMEKQVEVGLGPLHTQFDDKGYAYTSLFIESSVARWTLGGPHQEKHSEPAWSLLSKTNVHYNVGHVATAEGDTVSPDGKYLVSLDKWSIDRFQNVGPLMPQNLQLIDISKGGDQMPLLYDMPIGLGEPHYAQIVKADKLNPLKTFPKGEDAIEPSEARIERRGDTVEIWMSAVRSHFAPERIKVEEGDHVIWHISNIEQARDATHGFTLPDYDIQLSLEPGETQTVEFDATKSGSFSFYCTEFCSALHLEMAGYFQVKPKE